MTRRYLRALELTRIKLMCKTLQGYCNELGSLFTGLQQLCSLTRIRGTFRQHFYPGHVSYEGKMIRHSCWRVRLRWAS